MMERPTTTVESPIPPSTHKDKILVAVRALLALGALGSGLKDAEARRKIKGWLRSHGYAEADIPSDPTFKRVLPKLRIMWRTAK